MSADDVTAMLAYAIAVSEVDYGYVHHRPRLLSDNGSTYICGDLRKNLVEQGLTHTPGRPYRP